MWNFQGWTRDIPTVISHPPQCLLNLWWLLAAKRLQLPLLGPPAKHGLKEQNIQHTGVATISQVHSMGWTVYIYQHEWYKLGVNVGKKNPVPWSIWVIYRWWSTLTYKTLLSSWKPPYKRWWPRTSRDHALHKSQCRNEFEDLGEIPALAGQCESNPQAVSYLLVI